MAARRAVSFLYGHDPWVVDHAPLDGPTAMHIWATQIRLSEFKKKKKTGQAWWYTLQSQHSRGRVLYCTSNSVSLKASWPIY